MSLIFGINLCDRIYLAADSRVTKIRSDGSVESYRDEILKIEPISEGVSIATAGDIRMASFLVSKILQSELRNQDIRTIRLNIERFLPALVDRYYQKHGKGEVCLLFGGVNKDAQKMIGPGKSFVDLVREFQTLSPHSSMNMKEALFQGIIAKPNQPNPNPTLPVSDSHIFAVLISTQGYRFEDAEWAEYLAYGASSIRKDAVPRVFLGKLEFEAEAGNLSHDYACIVALMKDIARRFREQTIGGSIATLMVTGSGYGLIISTVKKAKLTPFTYEGIISEIQNKDGVIYGRGEDGILRKLISVREYGKVMSLGSFFI